MLLKILLAARRPACRHFHRGARASSVRRILRALIERHDDVGAQPDLRFHRALRAEEMRRAVEVRAERHTFLVDFAQFVEAEDLKSARVGQDRPPPRHESMQPAHPSHGLNPWPQVEVIRIAENDVRAQLFERVLRHAFDRRHRSHRHEHRCLDLGVRSEQAPEASFAADGIDVEGKGHSLGL